jgi:hypothetical protein
VQSIYILFGDRSASSADKKTVQSIYILFGDRLMVGHLVLIQAIGVRIPISEKKTPREWCFFDGVESKTVCFLRIRRPERCATTLSGEEHREARLKAEKAEADES